MKKVCIVFNHLNYSDGVSRAAIGIANLLSDNDYEVDLIPIYSFEPSICTLLHKNVRVKSVFGFYFRGLDKIVSLIPYSILYKLFVKSDYDLEIGFQDGISTKIIASSNNSNAVHLGWIHTTDEKLSLLSYYQRLDYVICVSKSIANMVNIKSNHSVNIECLYNLINDNLIKSQAKEQIDISPSNRPLLISVGRLSPEKGFSRLINILSRLRAEGLKYELWLVGDGPEYKNLYKLIDSLNLRDSIKLLGNQSNPHKYTAKADLFICSSFREGYSTACTEAAILGIPIISTNVSGAEEIINDAGVGSIVGIDDESLENELRRVLLANSIIEIWKEKARSSANNFSLETRKNRMMTFIDSLFVEPCKMD